jgi:NADH-quinone oxidoreductase subunit E/NADP-reducing hydrogenase subunit HndA
VVEGYSETSIEVVARLLVDDYLARFEGGRERLVPLLFRLQDHLGHISASVESYVASKLGISPVQVHGVLSFYNYFSFEPRGSYHLKLCLGTACFVRKGRRMMESIHEELGIDAGQTTDDGLFSLQVVRCIGACGLSPAMMINNQLFGDLSAPAVVSILHRLRASAESATHLKPERE